MELYLCYPHTASRYAQEKLYLYLPSNVLHVTAAVYDRLSDQKDDYVQTSELPSAKGKKAPRGSRGMVPLNLNLSTRWR
jgi:hypothetical protein